MKFNKLIINFLNKFLDVFNVQIIKKTFLEKLLRNQLTDLEMLKKIEKNQRSNFIENLDF